MLCTKYFSAIALLALATSGAAIAAEDEPSEQASDNQAQDIKSRNSKGEAKLAELLKGRVAGEPKRCLSNVQRRNMKIIDRTAFVFRDGDTIYVNRPGGANFLSNWSVPVFHPVGSRLCRLDHVQMQDRASYISGAMLSLGDFVPYRLVEEAE